MPGMGTYLQTKNSVIDSAFHTALFHQFLFIALLLVVLSVVWNVVRTIQYRRAGAGTDGSSDTGTDAATVEGVVKGVPAEPAARRVLRIGFGVFWIIDGLLQLQPSMPLGLPTSVLQPSADSSPGWVQHVVNVAVTVWSRHPVQAASAAVWIELGLGAALLLAPRGRWSRFAGLAATGWALVVWVFGEGFGGILGHGATWLFGTPGAALFYGVAGALVALPERVWWRPTVGRVILRASGVFFVAMAVLQAWPGRGFWQGSVRQGGPGTLTAMVRLMAQTGQPALLSAAIRAFARLDGAHGWGVNLVIVLLLAAIGLSFVTTRPRIVRPAVYVAVALCIADWIFVQDLGFFGGVGTDPNSMLPMAVVFVSAYLAVVQVPVAAEVPVVTPGAVPAEVAAPVGVPADGRPWWDRLAPGYLAQALAAVAALVVVLVGAVPLASAAINPVADPILAVAVDGTPNPVDLPAPPFRLVDQEGRAVTLSDLRGRTVALTFLDPVCTSDCPLIAREFLEANAMLGADASRVVFVAVVANEIYRSTVFTNAFDRQEGLEHMRNWLYLTGSLSELRQVWDHYGIAAYVVPAGAMVAHGDIAYLIDSRGQTRLILSTDPGEGSPSSMSSFSGYLATAIEHLIHA